VVLLTSWTNYESFGWGWLVDLATQVVTNEAIQVELAKCQISGKVDIICRGDSEALLTLWIYRISCLFCHPLGSSKRVGNKKIPLSRLFQRLAVTRVINNSRAARLKGFLLTSLDPKS